MELLAETIGGANTRLVGDNRYRQILVRRHASWPEVRRTVLWVGMNPSIADKRIDDNTCRREQQKSRILGFSRYFKGNVLDIMQTDPGLIPRELGAARTDNNLDCIRKMALKSDWVFLAYGSMPARFRPAIDETLAVLFATGRPMACFGRNGDGSPKHTRALANVEIPSQPQQLVDIRLEYEP